MDLHFFPQISIIHLFLIIFQLIFHLHYNPYDRINHTNVLEYFRFLEDFLHRTNHLNLLDLYHIFPLNIFFLIPFLLFILFFFVLLILIF